MSKAGSKIIKGLKEAHAVAKGKPPPGTRVTTWAVGDAKLSDSELAAWIAGASFMAKGHGKPLKITIEFPPAQRIKKEKRAHGRKS